jgi:hypothetical protein
MSIIDVIQRARIEPPYRPTHYLPLADLICRVNDPIAWDRNEIERELGLEIPEDLTTLWKTCGGMLLYQEPQGGLIVLSPLEAVAKQREYRRERESDARPGDLIFAEFYADLRLVLIRSDKNANDYGTIMIVAEMDERPDWYTPARTLEEFLIRYMDAHGDDYWDVHYQKILANRAKAQKSC